MALPIVFLNLVQDQYGVHSLLLCLQKDDGCHLRKPLFPDREWHNHKTKYRMELGIYTFADMAPEPVAGKAHNTHRRIAELMEEITLADQVGLDVFAVGEHHRPEYAVSSPAVILGAAAVATKKIIK